MTFLIMFLAVVLVVAGIHTDDTTKGKQQQQAGGMTFPFAVLHYYGFISGVQWQKR